MSQLVRAALDCFFDRETHDSSSAGVLLDVKGCSPLRVFLRLGTFLADEAALHAALKCKGSSGLKPCFLCSNVFNRLSTRKCVEADASGSSVYHTCTDPTKLKLHTTETIAAVQDRLQGAVGTVSKKDFDELETIIGWSFDPHGLLQHPRWRELCSPSEHMMYDFMHVYLVGGVFNIHVGHLLHAVKEFAIAQQVLEQYCGMFTWPASMQGKGSYVFIKTRYQSNLERMVAESDCF